MHARDKLLPTPGTQTSWIIHSQRNYIRPMREFRLVQTTRFHQLRGKIGPDTCARLDPQQEQSDCCGPPPPHAGLPGTNLGTITRLCQHGYGLMIHYNAQNNVDAGSLSSDYFLDGSKEHYVTRIFAPSGHRSVMHILVRASTRAQNSTCVTSTIDCNIVFNTILIIQYWTGYLK